MKIVVGGSMTFAKEQLEAKKFLEEKGNIVLVTEDINHYDELINKCQALKYTFNASKPQALKEEIMREIRGAISI